MKQYVRIFNELKNESGRIAKENLLRKYENVEGLKEIFQFSFNPFIVTGLAKAKITKDVCLPTYTPLHDIFDAIAYVTIHNTGTDQVVQSLQKFLNNLETQEEKDLAIGILIKDLPIGISLTTLNKIYGKDFIPTYGVMLAGKYVPGKSDLSKGFSLSLKLDGNRITCFNFEDGPKFYARSGKEIDGLVELEEEFRKLPKNMVYDGEVLAKNPDNLPSKELFNVTQTLVRRKGNKTGLNFVMFDLLPINDFNRGKSDLTYKHRKFSLDALFGNISESSLIKKVPIYYTGDDESVIPEILAEVEEQGFEGLMINLLNGHYQTKRSKGILKVKSFHSADLLCVGVKEDIRAQGKAGSLEVDYKGFKVSVAGLKENEKIEFWNNPESIVGKIIEVKYFEESTNQQGTLSLRFPNFIRIRDEKTINDISYA